MKYFSILIICFVFTIQPNEIKATHIMGGEITWECLPSGMFRFEMKIYRDCNGVALNNFYEPLMGHNGAPNISLTLVSTTDISPDCALGGGSEISCGAGPPFAHFAGTGLGAVQENVYRSGNIMLSGVPPAAGWVFTWDSCCRNASVVNLVSASGQGHTLRAIMYPYIPAGATAALNTSPCYDSSPRFGEMPNLIACSANSFDYNHNAEDAEMDSLHYSWADPFDDMTGAFNPPTNPSAVVWEAGYSSVSPLPGLAQNPANIPAILDPTTGQISCTSFTTGGFVTCVKVESWKSNQLVAEIFRDIQMTLISCGGANVPPSSSVSTSTSSVPITSNGLVLSALVGLGDTIALNLSSIDTDTAANSSLPQNILLEASGSNFANPIDVASLNCPFPPCATLTPVAGQSGFISTLSNSADFLWITDANHLTGQMNGGVYSNTYSFNFTFTDDFCPVPGSVSQSLLVKIQLEPAGPPIFDSIRSNSSNALHLHYMPPTDTADIFGYYLIHHKSAFGPTQGYYVVDTVYSHQSTLAVLPSFANGWDGYYFIQSNNKYGLPGLSSDTLAYGASLGRVEYSMKSLYVSVTKDRWIVGGLDEGQNDIDIVALDGRLIYSIKDFEGEEFVWTPQSTLSKGMYLVQVQGEKRIGRTKCLVP